MYLPMVFNSIILLGTKICHVKQMSYYLVSYYLRGPVLQSKYGFSQLCLFELEIIYDTHQTEEPLCKCATGTAERARLVKNRPKLVNQRRRSTTNERKSKIENATSDIIVHGDVFQRVESVRVVSYIFRVCGVLRPSIV